MAISTQLLALIKNIYTLWGLPRLLLPVTYFFLINLIYPQGIQIMLKFERDTHLRVDLRLSHIVKFIANHNYAKITMTETVQDLISYGAAVLQKSHINMCRY